MPGARAVMVLTQREASLTFCAMHNIQTASHNGVRALLPRRTRKGSPMTQPFEDANKVGKEYLDASLKSFAALSKSVQAIGVEASEYTKKSFEAGSAAFEKLVSAKSLDKVFEVQTDYAKQAYESFVAEATKLGELYAEVAKDAYKPFEAVVAKAK